ncbi:hypothetical protein [Thermosipho globiformans]|uniref:hypothetical protein n=1 Tax=Thermosipho globiformans TaxID=380685 RepID=UPI000F8D2221|nr:hypothetical protein [Thermosipho globiformans]
MELTPQQRKLMTETIKKWKAIEMEKGLKEQFDKKRKNKIDIERKMKYYLTITLPNLKKLQEALYGQKEDKK